MKKIISFILIYLICSLIFFYLFNILPKFFKRYYNIFYYSIFYYKFLNNKKIYLIILKNKIYNLYLISITFLK